MNDTVITDAALAARDGDRSAAARFVELTQHQLWQLLVHLADRQNAADLAQETYERAFGSLHRFRSEAPARAWLLAIARRVAADHLRRRDRRPAQPAPIHDDDRPLGVAQPGNVTEHVALRLALDAVPTTLREAFVLTQLIGLDYADAAHVAGCPIGTIRSRVARARGHLADALARVPHNSAGLEVLLG